MKNKKILIVEDDVDLMKVISLRIKSKKFEIVQATSGYEGLYRYLTETPDLIVLDLMLPTLNGNEVCREIRRKHKDEKTPIIILTAKSTDVDRIKSKVIGANSYITKPFDGQQLLEEISKYLI